MPACDEPACNGPSAGRTGGMPAGLVSQNHIARELTALGVTGGDVVLVHASLKSMGYVVGGPGSVMRGLFAAVGTGAPWSCRRFRPT